MALLAILVFVAVVLTITMFNSRNSMLGFPSAIFFALTGGQAYTLSTVAWDIYFILAFACLLGMTVFCMLAMYGLRPEDLEGPDADEGAYFDEKPEPDLRGGVEGEQPSARVKAVRARAEKRRKKETKRRGLW